MTTRVGPLTSSFPVGSRFGWARLAFTFVLTLSAILVFGATFAIGYARMNDGRVLPGVDVAGVDVAGLSRSSAEARLRAELPRINAGTLSVRIANVVTDIPYADFERNYDFDYMLNRAFELGRASSFAEQLREQIAILVNGLSVPPVVTWNSEQLAMRVASVAAAVQVAPVDAAITRQDGHYVVTPSSSGNAVNVNDAVEMAMAAVNNLSPADTAIAIPGTTVSPAVSTELAQAAADQAERVAAADLTVAAADLSTTIDANVLRGWIHLDAVAVGQWHLTIEAEPIAQYLSNYALGADTPPTNASFTFSGANVEVVPSALGRAVDVETTTANVLASLEARVGGQPEATVNLALVPVEPALNTSDAQALASRVTMLGTWTTNYIPSIANGQGVNIQIPTRKIDGYVVQPGEQFDFLTAIGPITSPPYESGGVLIHGQIREDGAIGGGMCSTSTTLFNAAMRAGLQIDARGNHSIYIARYPVGLDATVWEAGAVRRTMAFTNDTGYPILIKGINRPGKVTFEIYGIDDGRTVELSNPRVENVVPASAWLEYSDELPSGERRKEQDRYDAFESWVTRTVRDVPGNVIYQDTFYSNYRKLDAITLVGRYPDDPPAGTRIPPDAYPHSVPGT